MELLPEDTGIVRLAKVMVRGKEMLKTLEKLVPLEVGPPDETEESVDDGANQDPVLEEPPEDPVPQLGTSHPVHATAQRARDTRRKPISQGLL